MSEYTPEFKLKIVEHYLQTNCSKKALLGNSKFLEVMSKSGLLYMKIKVRQAWFLPIQTILKSLN